MTRRMSMSFVTILVLVNCIFVSSASQTYDASTTSMGILALDKNDIASPEVKARHFANNNNTLPSGLLRVGTQRQKDTFWESRIEIKNEENTPVHFSIEIKVEGTKHFHYLSVMGEPGSSPTSIHSPEGPKQSTNEFHVDLAPKSRSIMSVLVGGH